MTYPCRRFVAFFVVAYGLTVDAAAYAAKEVAVQSPNGKVRLVLQITDDGKPRFSVERNGQLIIEPSSLDVRLAEIGSIAAGASITNSHQWVIDESGDLPWGKMRRIRNHCHAATARIKGDSGVSWDVELRAYDDRGRFLGMVQGAPDGRVRPVRLFVDVAAG